MAEQGGSWNFGNFVDALDEDMSFRDSTEPAKTGEGFMEDDSGLSDSFEQPRSNEKSRKSD